MRGLTAALVICSALPWLVGCDPFESPRNAQREQIRRDCGDQVCTGDVVPAASQGQDVLKFNNTWYFAPRRYVMGSTGLVFYWPSKTPLTGLEDGGFYPERQQQFADKAIEIFLTGRQRWPEPSVERPWERHTWQQRWDELAAQGFVMKRTSLRPGLDEIRFSHPAGKPYNYVHYVAVHRKRIRTDEAPVLSCRIDGDPQPRHRCTAGEYWQPDVYADFRFRAHHAKDWPEIHTEIVRVLNLLKKA